jgi:hypothetical protein
MNDVFDLQENQCIGDQWICAMTKECKMSHRVVIYSLLSFGIAQCFAR